jgi:hypothetical protein
MPTMAAANVMEACTFCPFVQKRNICRTHPKMQSIWMIPSGTLEGLVLTAMSQRPIAIRTTGRISQITRRILICLFCRVVMRKTLTFRRDYSNLEITLLIAAE